MAAKPDKQFLVFRHMAVLVEIDDNRLRKFQDVRVSLLCEGMAVSIVKDPHDDLAVLIHLELNMVAVGLVDSDDGVRKSFPQIIVMMFCPVVGHLAV